MLPYWYLFLFAAVASLIAVRQTPGVAVEGETSPSFAEGSREGTGTLLFAIFLLCLTLLIGLRLEVGGDWLNYLRIFERSRVLSLAQQLNAGDPGYQVLNWLVATSGGDIWLVNLACAVLFCWGLHRLGRTQPEPWLVIVVAVPYMIVVVAMGYTRQAAALGVLMAGLAAVLRGGSVFRFTLYVAVAALFHRTAIVMLPLMTFVFPRSRGVNLLMVIALSLSLYVLFLQDSLEGFQRSYIDARYSSSGAGVRVAQLALAASLFFVFRKWLRMNHVETMIWRNFSAAVFAMAVLLFVLPSSTVVDRISLYLLPLQLAVLARLPLATTAPVLVRMAVVTYSAVVLYVWLNYAVNSRFWLPYKTIFAENGLS